MVGYRTFTVLVTACPVLFSVGSERSQDSRDGVPLPAACSEPVLKAEDEPKTVIEKAVKAHGGEKAFSRWSCGYLKYKTKGGVLPAELGEVTVEDTFQLPGHFKRVVRTDAGGKELRMVFVVNHGKGWTKKGDAPAVPIDNNVTQQTEHLFARFCNLASLTEAEVGLTKLKGVGKINGKDAIGLRAQSDELGEVEFHFDLQTGLLLKSRKSLPGADPDKPVVMESVLDEYKEVQGSPVPMRIKGVQDGKTILDVTLIDVKFTDEFEEGTFAKP